MGGKGILIDISQLIGNTDCFFGLRDPIPLVIFSVHFDAYPGIRFFSIQLCCHAKRRQAGVY